LLLSISSVYASLFFPMPNNMFFYILHCTSLSATLEDKCTKYFHSICRLATSLHGTYDDSLTEDFSVIELVCSSIHS
jgi:hypothetical protein